MMVFACTIFSAKLDATNLWPWKSMHRFLNWLQSRFFSSKNGIDDMYIDIDRALWEFEAWKRMFGKEKLAAGLSRDDSINWPHEWLKEWR
jgi:hypothetical protein